MENSMSSLTLSQLNMHGDASLTAKATVTKMKRMFEYVEEQPVYNRGSFCETIGSILEREPHLAQLRVFSPQNNNSVFHHRES